VPPSPRLTITFLQCSPSSARPLCDERPLRHLSRIPVSVTSTAGGGDSRLALGQPLPVAFWLWSCEDHVGKMGRRKAVLSSSLFPFENWLYLFRFLLFYMHIPPATALSRPLFSCESSTEESSVGLDPGSFLESGGWPVGWDSVEYVSRYNISHAAHHRTPGALS